MSDMISFGWWIAPAIITAHAITSAWWPNHHEYPGECPMDLVVTVVARMAAIILSLLAWLIWSLFS